MARRSTLLSLPGAAPAAAVLLLVSITTSAPATAQPEADSGVQYDAGTGALSVDVHEADLAEVIHEVERQSGKRIELVGDVESPVTARFQGLPLRTGLVRLLDGIDHLMAGQGEANIKIWVLNAKGGAPTPPPPPRVGSRAAPREEAPPAAEAAEGELQQDEAAELERLLQEVEDPQARERLQQELESIRATPDDPSEDH